MRSSPRTLVFIDEGGSPHREERLSLGSAAWCSSSSKGGVQLRYGIDQARLLAGEVERMPKGTRHSDGPRGRATEIIELI